ncbi:MAG: glycosyl transferase family protein [Limisphaerales bacterium]|nr:MAG: glycosyl transferase family protein [Limisphaerales bacterium]KAG0508316.1 MAG: glycosyl transferase family protein [Limisphaerales bacterium]TXT49631.1 MAG: glycosyl transferase family protein [Limisphaerales bacterium]
MAESTGSISVIIPTLNEAAELPETLRRLRLVPEVREVIIADGGSRDDTVKLAQEAGRMVVNCESGRGRQLRAGAERATGEVVLFLHADTWVPPAAGRALLACLARPGVVAGGFYKVFRDPPSWLVRGSRFKCWWRLLVARRVMADQGIFLRRETLTRIGGVPDVPLMEEFELCKRLRLLGRIALADATVVTSARKFRKLGVLRTYALMWRVTAGYHRGVPLEELRRWYEGEGVKRNA